MSVLNEDFKDSYVGRADTGPYAITFDVNLDDGGNAMDIVVKLIDDTGAESDITTECTIVGLNVYTTASYAATNQVVLIRYPDLTQPYTFPFGTQFPSRTFEKALDRLLYTVQRLALETEQCLKVPIGEDAPERIPSVVDRGNKYAAYDADGEPIAAVDPGAYPASPFAATLLDDLSASAVLSTLGITAEVETNETSDVSEAAVTAGTWYNIGTLSIALAAGVYDVTYFANVYFEANNTQEKCFVTLSTANSSESDKGMTAVIQNPHSASAMFTVPMTRTKRITLVSPTTYYLLAKSDGAGNNITFKGTEGTTRIFAHKVG